MPTQNTVEEVWQGNRKNHETKNLIIRFLHDNLKRHTLGMLDGLKIETILDVGCGEGFFTHEIGKRYPNSNITGIDMENEYINLANKIHKLDNITYTNKDVESLNSDEKYDLVILTEVLEHLNNPDKMLEKIKSISAKYILISVPNEPFFRLGNIVALKYLKTLGNTPGHLHNWSRMKFTKKLKKLGFNFTIRTSSFWNIALIKQ
ncbi:MAG: class I SAM-dependent methyltransferase [bacterium]|nr:class I SAM-dependent methyltransferase [bacterium]